MKGHEHYPTDAKGRYSNEYIVDLSTTSTALLLKVCMGCVGNSTEVCNFIPHVLHGSVCSSGTTVMCLIRPLSSQPPLERENRKNISLFGMFKYLAKLGETFNKLHRHIMSNNLRTHSNIFLYDMNI